MGACISKGGAALPHQIVETQELSQTHAGANNQMPVDGQQRSASAFPDLQRRRQSAGATRRVKTAIFKGDLNNTLFFGRQDTQEELVLWAHGNDHNALELSNENRLIKVRQFLGGNDLFDPELKCPELNQEFADHLRNDPKRSSAVNAENRENFSEEKPNMSIAMCVGIDQKLRYTECQALEQQAALNETEVFSRKSKGAISFAVETGRDIAFGMAGREEMTSAPAKKRFFKHGFDAKTSVTDSELRFLYRNRNDPSYQERVKFYQARLDAHRPEFEQCNPPWDLEPQAWAAYKPKSGS
jgi:hypothetical protein